MLKKTTLCCASILLAMLFAGTAQADPVTITGGGFTGEPEGRGRYWVMNVIVAPNFSVAANGNVFSTPGGSGYLQPGTLITVSGSPGGEMPYRGLIYDNNVVYEMTVNLSVQFSPVSFVVPELGLFERQTITGTFSMTGTADYFSGSSVPPYQGQTHFDLVGSGTASFYLFMDGLGVRLERISYIFEEPEPVPEPATLVLLSTGLAGAIGAARKRRGVKNES